MFPTLHLCERSSRRAWRCRLVAIGAAGFALLAPPSARAEDSSDAAVTAAARALAVEGVKLAQTDHCAEALDKLERAEQLHHSPIVLAQLGECYVKLGRLVEGVECLRGVTREALPANQSDAMREAHARSKALLEATRGKIATLTISVDAPNAEPSVSVDDKPVPVALLGAGRPTDPGEHSVTASAPGYLTAARRLTIGPGEEQTLTLALVMDPGAARSQTAAPMKHLDSSRTAAARTLASPPSAASDKPTDQTSRLVPAYVAWAVGAVALGVGVGFGVAALGDQHQLRQRCPGKLCSPEQRDLLDTAHSDATVSTIGYAAAIGGAAIGSLLFFVLNAPSQPDSDQVPSAKLAARVGLGGADLALRF
jgi:hypothetical protein